MSWQLVAIWAIVSGAIIWFVRDERIMRRVRQNGRLQRFGSTPVAVARRTPAPSTFRKDSAEAIAVRQSFVDAMRNSKN